MCKQLASPRARPQFVIVVTFQLVICSFVPYRYHRLMVMKYRNKREKFQVARSCGQQRKGGQSGEIEWLMDMELFLKGQARWGKRPALTAWQWCMILFLHAAAEGWKEAEWIVHWGHWQKMPQLNLEAGHTCHSAGGTRNLRKRIARNYIWRSTNYIDFQGLLLGNQHVLREVWCPLSKTTKGGGRRGHLLPQQDPS